MKMEEWRSEAFSVLMGAWNSTPSLKLQGSKMFAKDLRKYMARAVPVTGDRSWSTFCPAHAPTFCGTLGWPGDRSRLSWVWHRGLAVAKQFFSNESHKHLEC